MKMRASIKTCIYISGPPCVGKSTVARGIQRFVPKIQHVRGDDYWTMYPDLLFGERVAKVNQHVLTSVRDTASADVLCEWVPCRGLFVVQLYNICVSAGRQFYHVILTAPVSVLKRRKMERDGDEDIGPEVVTAPEQEKAYEWQVFDTDREERSAIVGEICRWVL